MFKRFIDKLAQVTRFDRIVNSAKLAIGAVEDRGVERLALQLPSSEVLVMEEQGEQALLRQFAIPPSHFFRLSPDLKAHELSFFTKSAGRDIMLRAVQTDEQYPRLRGVVSSSYSPFDNMDVMEALGDELAGWDIVSSQVGRDEMRLQAAMPQEFDVSKRQVGDTVRAALTISNHELGFGPAAIFFSLYKLSCRNGMTSMQQIACRVIHRWASRDSFIAKLRQAVADAGVAGEAMARLLRRTHELRLTAVDPDGDKLSRSVLSILRSENVFNKQLQEQMNEALRQSPELFTAVQVVSDASRLEQGSLQARNAFERASGRMIHLAS